MTRPPAEIRIDVSLVRRLLQAECPALAGAPLHLVDEGWDNVTVRIGARHAARLPRRQVAVALLVNEQRWLPLLAERIPLAVPTPVHAGAAGPIFPWPWSVVRWVPGETADAHAFSFADAELLAQSLRALHQPAPDDAPVNPMRGLPLETRQELVDQRLRRLASTPGIDASRLRAIWDEARSVPHAAARLWIHGDLHPRNVLTRDGSLGGLIDWGDLNGGDAATDVACAWMLMDGADVRRRFLDAYRPPEYVVPRARGWAVHMGLALVDSGEARHVPMGLAALNRVVSDARPE